MTMASLEQMAKGELIALWNRTPAGRSRPLRSWKKKRSLLEAMIREAGADPEAPRKRTIREAALALLCEVTHYEEKSKKPGSEGNAFDAPSPTRRSVGLQYDDILSRLRDEFPGSQTSLACLRWYAVKVRVEEHGYENLRLPQRRPRGGPPAGKKKGMKA